MQLKPQKSQPMSRIYNKRTNQGNKHHWSLNPNYNLIYCCNMFFYFYIPKQFEDFICELYKEKGYKAETTPFSGDYGVDVFAVKGNGWDY